MFKVGDLIYSEEFGRGKVVNVDQEEDIFPVTVEFFHDPYWQRSFTKEGLYFTEADGGKEDQRKIKHLQKLKDLIERGVE